MYKEISDFEVCEEELPIPKTWTETFFLVTSNERTTLSEITEH